MPDDRGTAAAVALGFIQAGEVAAVFAELGVPLQVFFDGGLLAGAVSELQIDVDQFEEQSVAPGAGGEEFIQLRPRTTPPRLLELPHRTLALHPVLAGEAAEAF